VPQGVATRGRRKKSRLLHVGQLVRGDLAPVSKSSGDAEGDGDEAQSEPDDGGDEDDLHTCVIGTSDAN